MSCCGTKTKKFQRAQTYKTLQNITRFQDEDLQDLMARFEKMTNGTGKLSNLQFRDNMGVLGLMQVHGISDRIFKLMDKDNNDQIGFEDFISYLDQIMNGSERDKAQISFALMDKEKKGYITIQDFGEMIISIVNAWSAFTGTNINKEMISTIQFYINTCFTSMINQNKNIDSRQQDRVDEETFLDAIKKNPNMLEVFSYLNKGFGDTVLKKEIRSREQQIISDIQQIERCLQSILSFLIGENQNLQSQKFTLQSNDPFANTENQQIIIAASGKQNHLGGIEIGQQPDGATKGVQSQIFDRNQDTQLMHQRSVFGKKAQSEVDPNEMGNEENQRDFIYNDDLINGGLFQKLTERLKSDSSPRVQDQNHQTKITFTKSIQPNESSGQNQDPYLDQEWNEKRFPDPGDPIAENSKQQSFFYDTNDKHPQQIYESSQQNDDKIVIQQAEVMFNNDYIQAEDNIFSGQEKKQPQLSQDLISFQNQVGFTQDENTNPMMASRPLYQMTGAIELCKKVVFSKIEPLKMPKEDEFYSDREQDLQKIPDLQNLSLSKAGFSLNSPKQSDKENEPRKISLSIDLPQKEDQKTKEKQEKIISPNNASSIQKQQQFQMTYHQTHSQYSNVNDNSFNGNNNINNHRLQLAAVKINQIISHLRILRLKVEQNSVIKFHENQSDFKLFAQFTVLNIPKLKQKVQRDNQKMVLLGHENYNLVLNMMLGIQMAVKSVSNVLFVQELVPQDYQLKYYFELLPRRQGDERSSYQICKFSDYAPNVFNKIRQLYQINNQDYLSSIGPETIFSSLIKGQFDTLQELTSSGKSGSFFYYTADGNFTLKTIHRGEFHFLKTILENYYNHLFQNQNSLIIKIYGLHQIRLQIAQSMRQQTIYFIIMGNVFNTIQEIHVRYDLKGSTYKRKVGKNQDPTIAQKEQDFDESKTQLKVTHEEYLFFMSTIRQDSQFFQENHIIDYSLLLGIHNIPKEDQSFKDIEKSIPETQIFKLNPFNLPVQQGGSMIMSDTSFYRQEEKDDQINKNSQMYSVNQEFQYYFGIIDILTQFNTQQKLEYLCQTLAFGPTISAIPPSNYGTRFEQYISTIFDESCKIPSYEEPQI